MSTKFFKPEDFEGFTISGKCAEVAASLANHKLEREGKVVYAREIKGAKFLWNSEEETKEKGYVFNDTHKALLINIEPIVKCDHPPSKIKLDTVSTGFVFACECGARVTPTAYKESE